MRISDLPVATNYAKVQSQLTQYQHTEGKTQTISDSSTETTFVRSLVSSDNDYTKSDAILKQWNKAGSFNLYDVLNGRKVNLQNPNPSTEELQEFEAALQKSGLQDGIDWGDFAFDLKGIGFGTNNPIYQLRADDFQRKTDYLASRYAAMQAKIEDNFSGNEQVEQLDKLNSVYQEALKELAEGYSAITGEFLEQNGVAGEREKIYSAVIDGVNGKVSEYQKYLSDNPNFAGLKGTKDEWLLEDDEYIASLLRNKTIGSQEATTKNDSYSLNDLDIMGRYVSELSSWEKSNSVTSMDEEHIGLDFAMLAMKTAELSKGSKISSALNSTLQKTVSGFMAHYLNRMDSRLADLRDASLALNDKQGFAALDRQAVWNVFNKTMEHYKSTGNAVDALVQGARYGAEQALEKSNSGTYRHTNNRLYWANFFSNKDSDFPKNDYQSFETTYQKYVSGWNDFTNSLNDKNGVRLNMNIKPSYFYQAGVISNKLNIMV